MNAKTRHKPATSPRQPDIARLRKAAIRFRRFVDRHMRTAMKAAPGKMAVTFMVTTHKPGGEIMQIIHNWPPQPTSGPPVPGVH